MANNYSEGTGVLVFNGTPTVTPALHAVFKPFNMGEAPRHGEVYINRPPCDAATWQDVFNEAKALAGSLGVPVDDEIDDFDALKALLVLLACRFGVDASRAQEVVEGILGQYDDLYCNVEINHAYELAMLLQDGHSLRGILFGGAWYCDKLRLREQGGYAEIVTRKIEVFDNTSAVMRYAELLDRALEEGDLKKACDAVADRVSLQLEAVRDGELRKQLTAMVMSRLAMDLAKSPTTPASRDKGGV